MKRINLSTKNSNNKRYFYPGIRKPALQLKNRATKRGALLKRNKRFPLWRHFKRGKCALKRNQPSLSRVFTEASSRVTLIYFVLRLLTTINYLIFKRRRLLLMRIKINFGGDFLHLILANEIDSCDRCRLIRKLQRYLCLRLVQIIGNCLLLPIVMLL